MWLALVGLGALLLGVTAARADDAQERRSESLSGELLEWEHEEVEETRSLEWSWGDGTGFRVRSADGSRRLHLGGRLLLDGGLIHYGDDLAPRADSGWDAEGEVRQARLFVQGSVFRRLLFKVEYEVADTEFKDVYVGLRKLGPLGTLQVGYMGEPFSLEQRMSTLHITFMERSLMNALVPHRNSGLLLTNTLFGDRLRWALGAFVIVDSFQERKDPAEGFEDDWEITGRFTGVLLEEDDGRHLLTAGLSYSHTFADAENVTYETRPESFLAKALLETPPIDQVDGQDRVGLEAAWVRGPFSIQAEAVALQIDRGSGSDLTFWGGYLQASHFLTGEHRIYGKKVGLFTRVVPSEPFRWGGGTWGAFEVAARLSYLDLDDHDVRGGRELNATVGLNWYLLANMRMTLNAIFAHVRSADDAFILQARFQVDF